MCECVNVRMQEVALIGLLSYLSYLMAEVMGLSGILSLFCCGIVVSHFALTNMWVTHTGCVTLMYGLCICCLYAGTCGHAGTIAT